MSVQRRLKETDCFEDNVVFRGGGLSVAEESVEGSDFGVVDELCT